MRFRKDQRGFTFTEMSLVLVMSGMMLGTALNGQAMVQNFMIKSMTEEIKLINMACMTYFNRYNAMPGDDPRSHGWGGVSVGNGDGFIEGNMNAWQALFRSGLMSDDPGMTETVKIPASPFGGKYLLGHKNFGGRLGKRNYVLVENLPARIVESIDSKYDDGKSDAGMIRANKRYSGGPVDLYYIF